MEMLTDEQMERRIQENAQWIIENLPKLLEWMTPLGVPVLVSEVRRKWESIGIPFDSINTYRKKLWHERSLFIKSERDDDGKWAWTRLTAEEASQELIANIVVERWAHEQAKGTAAQ